MATLNLLDGFFVTDEIEEAKLEKWREEYKEYSYLNGADDSKILERLKCLLNNIVSFSLAGEPQLLRTEDDYFFKRLVHVKEELKRRETIDKEEFKNELKIEEKVKKAKEIANNIKKRELSDSYLIKYSKKKFIKRFVEQGEVYFNNAKSYDDTTLPSAIYDNELEYTEYSGEETTIKLDSIPLQAQEITMRAPMKSDYLVYCLSTLYNYRFFDDFDSNACAIITDPEEFLDRLKFSIDEHKILSEWIYDYGQVSYYDPCLTNGKGFSDKESINIPFTKELKYKFEREFRCVLLPDSPRENLEPISIKIGSLEDICEIIFLD